MLYIVVVEALKVQMHYLQVEMLYCWVKYRNGRCVVLPDIYSDTFIVQSAYQNSTGFQGHNGMAYLHRTINIPNYNRESGIYGYKLIPKPDQSLWQVFIN